VFDPRRATSVRSEHGRGSIRGSGAPHLSARQFTAALSGCIIGSMRKQGHRRAGRKNLTLQSKSNLFPCANLTMRSSGPRGEAIVFPDVVSARGRLTRR
jgi:hypothetical protein